MALDVIAGLEFDALFMVKDSHDQMLAMRYRTTSDSRANAIGQNCGSSTVRIRYSSYPTRGNYYHMIQKVAAKHSVFYEGYVVNEAVDKEVLFTTQEKMLEDFHNLLMNNFKLALPQEFTKYLLDELTRRNCVTNVCRPYVLNGNHLAEETHIVHGTLDVPIEELKVLDCRGISEEMLRTVVSEGLEKGKIFLDETGHRAMQSLEVEGMDEYIQDFGKSICDNLENESIKPHSKQLKRSVEGLALLTRKLYSPQAASCDGIVETMRSGGKAILVSEEMGCGKTIQAAAAVEAYYNRKWLDQHPGTTLKDCFESGEVSYRSLVLCPSHLTEKWKLEVEKQIPGAKGIKVTDISQLEALRMRPAKERRGKEFYILSKEFAKGGTHKRPVPTKIGERVPVLNVCYDCAAASASDENEYHQRFLSMNEPWSSKVSGFSSLDIRYMPNVNGIPTCPQCGGHNTHLWELDYPRIYEDKNGVGHNTNRHKGLLCPECDNLLLRPSFSLFKQEVEAEKFADCILQPHNFFSKSQGNEACPICGCPLWEDNVEPMDISIDGTQTSAVKPEEEKKGWVKIKFCGDYAKLKLADKKKRLNKSGYALRGHELETVMALGVGTKDKEKGEESYEFVYADRTYGPRRYEPARFASKYLRGYFDVLIADEAHQYEGWKSEQAIACHNLMKTVKFSMFLTGTLTNGTAQSLFAIYWMVNPKRMKELGYSFTSQSCKDFSNMYGVVETKYELADESGAYNAQGRGRQIGQPRVKPGISPLIYPHLLLNQTVQLNISDMSNKLPELNEFVVPVTMNDDQARGYRHAIESLKEALKLKDIGAGLMGKLLQIGLSYPDKPYGRSPVYSHKVRDYCILELDNFEQYESTEHLLPKEEELIDIVNKEIGEDRNLFIYTEYSGSEETDVDGRLKEIVEKHCNLKGQVKVLKSGEVKASDREEFIKKNSAKYRVVITNYKNVETGIDFVGEYEGRKYNYPTIVFFQTGMSLSSVWQASRRHYRLNQTEECRTYYLVYANTFQIDMLEMMSKKMSAASAIQGNFSESALQNMAGSEDPSVVLAKKILSGQTGGNNSEDVQAQLAATRQSAIASCDENLFSGPDPVTFYDVMGEGAKYVPANLVEEEQKEEPMSLMDFMEEIETPAKKADEDKAEVKPEDVPENEEPRKIMTPEDVYASMSEEEISKELEMGFGEVFKIRTITEKERMAVKKRYRPLAGQPTLFDLIA